MSLRSIVKKTSGQDVAICHACSDCDPDNPGEMDIPLSSLVQLVLLDDEEALESRTLWSDAVLQNSRTACKRGLRLDAIMLALREEANRRREQQGSH
jgi:hypothetical protein